MWCESGVCVVGGERGCGIRWVCGCGGVGGQGRGAAMVVSGRGVAPDGCSSG